MTGVFHFINPADHIPYFMTGAEDVFFSPLPENATVYTLSNPLGTYSFLVGGKIVPLFVSTQKDLTFRDISVFQGQTLQAAFGILFTSGDNENAVNGVRYKRALVCDGIVTGEETYIEYLQQPNYRFLFRLQDEDPRLIAAAQTRRSETYHGKANPQKGQTKEEVVDTLDPLIKFFVYILVIIAIFILFALTHNALKRD